jgi:L-ascorbate metabolism protein UlaG (beta-lactamase superfamily)
VAVDPDFYIRYLGHAAFLLRSPDGARLLVDPWDNEEDAPPWFANPFPQMQVDLLARSHEHFDHHGEHRVTVVHDTLLEPGTITFGEIGVRGIADEHAKYGGDNMVIVVEAGDARFVHMGDNRAEIPSAIVDHIGAVDMLVVHVDDNTHLQDFDAVDRMIDAFKPGVVVPNHYQHPAISAPTTEVGPIDEWLASQKRVKRFEGEIALSRKGFPDETEIWVFEPMPGPSTGV